MDSRTVRVVSVIMLRLDPYGWLLPPVCPWQRPAAAAVRIVVPRGAVDWTAETLDALVNATCAATSVQIDADDPRLAYQLGRAIERQHRPCCGVSA